MILRSLAAACAILCAAPAFAQSAAGDALVATANEWGGQGGAYTCQQWRAYVSRIYRVGDARHRGYMDAADFERIKAVSPVFAQASFDFFDQAGKGKITQKEFVEAQSPFFALFDKHRTCRVTREDIAAANKPAPASPLDRRRSGSGGPSMGDFGWRDH